MKCDELAAADSARDADRVERVVESMADIGTETEPTAVEPAVYLHVLLLLDAIRAGSQEAFNNEMDALLAECAKVER
jgi:hypothetical protein